MLFVYIPALVTIPRFLLYNEQITLIAYFNKEAMKGNKMVYGFINVLDMYCKYKYYKET